MMFWFPNISESCFKKRENFTTTKPNAITPIPVLNHAKKVLSLARWSLRFLGLSGCITNFS
jgi:hypothetical protein